MLDAGEREEYAETTEASTIVMIPADAMNAVVEQTPTLAVGITRLVGFRRRRIQRRLKNLLFRSNRERLVHLILELAEISALPPEWQRIAGNSFIAPGSGECHRQHA